MQPILLGGILSIAIFVLGLVGSSFYFYSIAIYRNRKEFLNDNEDLAPAQQNTDRSPELSGREWLAQQVWEEWVLTSSDGLRLVGAYLPAPKGTDKTAVLVHGYTSQGKDMGSFARFYYEKLGFNVLLPDNRGHGQSGGNYIGFGWPDRLDYLLWLEEILKRVGDQAQIVLHGISMGGATVLMVSGENLPKHVKAIVADCGYTSVKDQLAYQLKRMYKLPSFPILSATSLLTKLRAGYSF